MFRLFALSLLISAPALAQSNAASGTGETPTKVRTVFVYGNEPCPASSAGEVVVCRRAPEAEQYRIPPTLREPVPSPANQAWAARSESIMEANEEAIPGSCSPVGSGGQTGCSREALERWAAEKRAREGQTGIPLP